MADLRGFCDRKGIALIEDCAHALFGVVRRARHRELGRLCDREPDQVLLGAGGRLPDRQPAGIRGSRACAPDASRTRSSRWSTSSSSALAIDACPASTTRSDSCSRCGAGRAAPAPSGSSRWTSISRRARTPSTSSTAIAPSPGSRRRAGSSSERSADRALWSVAVTTTVRSPEGSPESPGVRVPWASLPHAAVPYVFPLWVDEPDAPYYALKAAGVPVFRWDRLWPGTPFLPGDEGYAWSRHILQLPCHQDLSAADLDWLVGKVDQALGYGARPSPRAGPHVRLPTASDTGASARKRVLMVAFHFPPLAGSSGIQRTLRFAQHLPALGWQPIVLTAHPRAYEATSDDLTSEIPRRSDREPRVRARRVAPSRDPRPLPGVRCAPRSLGLVVARRRSRGPAAHPAASAGRDLVDLPDRDRARDRRHARAPFGAALDRRLPRPHGAGGLSRRPGDVAPLRRDRGPGDPRGGAERLRCARRGAHVS